MPRPGNRTNGQNRRMKRSKSVLNGHSLSVKCLGPLSRAVIEATPLPGSGSIGQGPSRSMSVVRTLAFTGVGDGGDGSSPQSRRGERCVVLRASASFAGAVLHERDGLRAAPSPSPGERAVQPRTVNVPTGLPHRQSSLRLSAPAAIPISRRSTKAQSHGSRRGVWALGSRGLDAPNRDRLADPTARESSAGQLLGYSGLGASLLVVGDLTIRSRRDGISVARRCRIADCYHDHQFDEADVPTRRTP
jgi:hypothetical protein